MREKYLAGKFGNCPRVLCEKQNVIPIGISEDSKIARVKIYCPRCKDIYTPKKKPADVDGSYFGTSFPHLLLMVQTLLFRPIQILVLFSPENNMFQQYMVLKLNKGQQKEKLKIKLLIINNKRFYPKTKECKIIMINPKKHRLNKRRKIRRRKNDYINSVILDIKITKSFFFNFWDFL